MQNTQKLLITALLATGSLVTSAVAAPLTLEVAADNWVSGSTDFQDKHYGGWYKVTSESDGAYDLKDRIPFFRFDLSSYTGGTIADAELELFPYEQFSSTPQEFIIYGIIDGGASENFGEGATTTAGNNIETDPSLQTWNNSGYAYGGTDSLSDSASFGDLVDLGTLSGVTDDDIGSSVSFSSTALDAFLNNDGNNIATFLVYNTNGTGTFNGFRSKESPGAGTGTTLTLVPEPSSFVLLLGGFSLWIAAIRRRS
ncbi:MAG TPA: hypothetical protein DEA90_09555 [Opitutae bacterium]|nr:hypothetical protein [Puniceicoccaceae bacterium]HBR94395.1 hypothetical protein [Opitutae bacterium]|tara:strand:- start:2405 stop:3169 length:765 start_codon:yes stop_codon:yes gene_type:complete